MSFLIRAGGITLPSPAREAILVPACRHMCSTLNTYHKYYTYGKLTMSPLLRCENNY